MRWPSDDNIRLARNLLGAGRSIREVAELLRLRPVSIKGIASGHIVERSNQRQKPEKGEREPAAKTVRCPECGGKFVAGALKPNGLCTECACAAMTPGERERVRRIAQAREDREESNRQIFKRHSKAESMSLDDELATDGQSIHGLASPVDLHKQPSSYF